MNEPFSGPICTPLGPSVQPIKLLLHFMILLSCQSKMKYRTTLIY